MIIVKTGNPPNTPFEWWHGRRLCCSSCGCQFILEYTDKPMITQERHFNSIPVVSALCPTEGCYTTVSNCKDA